MCEKHHDTALNILHIASWYPSRISPQNGNFIQRHIDAISRLTNSCTLHVVSDSDMKSWNDVEVNINDYQSVVVVYPKGQFWSRLSRRQRAYSIGYQKIMGYDIKFDLIHVHVMFPAIAFVNRIADDLNVPILVTEHATAYHDYHPETYNWWQMLFLRRYSRKVQRYFPVSRDLEQSMRSKGIQGVYEVIPNVVDVEIFQPALVEHETDEFHFIHISSLKDEHKNVSGLLSVFAEVVEAHTHARLTIIGNDHHEQIQRYINILNLHHLVKLHTEISIEEVSYYLQKSHALVLFSNYENAPCVISEAHCVGLPVIATDVGGVSEMVDGTNGLLVNAGDIYGMYAAMCEMISGYSRFDRQAISNVASKVYSYDNVAVRYLSAYKKVLHGN